MTNKQSAEMFRPANGPVYLIGAGPGDPGLLTVRGREILRAAGAVVYDASLEPVFLQEAAENGTTEFIAVTGEAPSKTAARLAELSRAGFRVARLLTGDPFSQARAAAEAAGLQAAGVIYEVVPGLSSFLAGPAYAGVPLLYPELSGSFCVIGSEQAAQNLDFLRLAGLQSTLVFEGDAARLREIGIGLLAAGKDPATPLVVVSGSATWRQRSLSAELGGLVALLEASSVNFPALAVLGPVAGLREQLRWFDLPQVRPLLGRRIVITRAKEQSGGFVASLRELGANALEFPVIKIVDPDNFEPMDQAVARLAEFDWVVFTSVNGVDCFWKRLKLAGKDARAFARARICAIGPATAAALAERSLVPDFIPSKFVAESILEDIEVQAGQRFLLPRADIAREILIEGLQERGAYVENVVAYRTIAGGEDGPGETTPDELVRLLEAGEIDAVTFTSSSTVRNFAARLASASAKPLPELLSRTCVACIGPVTAGTARKLGLTVGLEAPEYTIDGLLGALVEQFAEKVTAGI